MSKKNKNALNKKMNLVFVSLLARITDFQLQSEDKEYFNKIEELRHFLVTLQEGMEK